MRLTTEEASLVADAMILAIDRSESATICRHCVEQKRCTNGLCEDCAGMVRDVAARIRAAVAMSSVPRVKRAGRRPAQ